MQVKLMRTRRGGFNRTSPYRELAYYCSTLICIGNGEVTFEEFCEVMAETMEENEECLRASFKVITMSEGIIQGDYNLSQGFIHSFIHSLYLYRKYAIFCSYNTAAGIGYRMPIIPLVCQTDPIQPFVQTKYNRYRVSRFFEHFFFAQKYFPSTILQLLDADHDGYLSLEEMYHLFFNEGQEKLTEDDRIEV